MQFSNYYPGNNYINILSLDVYGNEFNQANYDNLIMLSKDKPLVLVEVGNPPGHKIFKNQPKWVSYVVWAGIAQNTTKKQ